MGTRICLHSGNARDLQNEEEGISRSLKEIVKAESRGIWDEAGRRKRNRRKDLTARPPGGNDRPPTHVQVALG